MWWCFYYASTYYGDIFFLFWQAVCHKTMKCVFLQIQMCLEGSTQHLCIAWWLIYFCGCSVSTSLWILMKYYWQTPLKICAVYHLFILILFSLVNEHILSLFQHCIGFTWQDCGSGDHRVTSTRKRQGLPVSDTVSSVAPTNLPWGTPEPLSQFGGTSTRTLKKRQKTTDRERKRKQTNKQKIENHQRQHQGQRGRRTPFDPERTVVWGGPLMEEVPLQRDCANGWACAGADKPQKGLQPLGNPLEKGKRGRRREQQTETSASWPQLHCAGLWLTEGTECNLWW